MADNDNFQQPLRALQIQEPKNKKYATNSTTSTTSTGDRLDHDTKVLVNMIFARLSAIYGSKFDQQMQSNDNSLRAKREWGLAIVDLGLRIQAIERAIERCKQELEWPPSIAEFIKRSQVQAEQLGLPPARQAFEQACRCRVDPVEFPWSHAIVYQAARQVGLQRLWQEPENKSWPQFERTYQALVQRVGDGEAMASPARKPRLADNSALTGFEGIQQLAQQQQLSQELAHQLYFYLTQEPKSQRRAVLRGNAMAKAESLALALTFPE